MIDMPPPDDAAHLDFVLMAEITHANTLLGRYVVRFLDADAGRAEPLSTEDERALADQVSAVAEKMRARAMRRERNGNSRRFVDHRAGTTAVGPWPITAAVISPNF